MLQSWAWLTWSFVLGTALSGIGISIFLGVRAMLRRPVLVLSEHHQLAEGPASTKGGTKGFGSWRSASSSLVSGPIPPPGKQHGMFFRVGVSNIGGTRQDAARIFITRVSSNTLLKPWSGEIPLIWRDLKNAEPRSIPIRAEPIEADFGSVEASFPHFFHLEAVNADSALPMLGVGIHTFVFTAHGTGDAKPTELTVTIDHGGYWPNGTKVVSIIEKHAGRFFYLLTNPRTRLKYRD